MPAAILSFRTSRTLGIIPGGIGMFRYSHGECGTVGIIYGEKYSSFRVPHLTSSKVIPPSFNFITCWKSFSFSGHKKPVELTFNSFICSSVIFGVGMNSGGCMGSGVNVIRGLVGIWHFTWHSRGNWVDMGWIFLSTHL